MGNKPYEATSGYGKDWYPKIEPTIPRVYHEYIKDDNKDNLYSAEELGKNNAFFVLNPDKYKKLCYMGTSVNSIIEGPIKAELLPGSNKENNIERRVAVTNTCQEPVFVRVHLAIPRCLDDALPEFNAMYNMLHFNFRNEDIAKGMWNWSTSMDRPDGKAVNNNNWNYYTEIIDGEEYGVYVVTYESPLAPGATTEDVIHQVYLDAKAESEDLQKIFDILRTNEWDILVAVESTEVGEYKDPFTAFEFKAVGSYDPFEA